MLPKRRNSASASPGIVREHPLLLGDAKPRLEADQVPHLPARSSWRSWTTAYGSRPVRGSGRPTGFIGPKRSVSRPRRAISSTGMHPSKYGTASNSWAVNWSPASSASMNASYSSRDIGAFR